MVEDVSTLSTQNTVHVQLIELATIKRNIICNSLRRKFYCETTLPLIFSPRLTNPNLDKHCCTKKEFEQFVYTQNDFVDLARSLSLAFNKIACPVLKADKDHYFS